ncbi:MAG TPA: TonB-dependent receptor [Sphingomicrobium sp.]|nr:TonB-dependent receptor [Sphingomicrobium sp.]
MSKFAVRSLILASISPLAFAYPAYAQDTSPPPAPAPATAAQASAEAEGETPDESTIVVTGTRRTDRTVADSPVPIDVIGGEELTKTGLTETNKILNQLVPSFNFPQPSIADGTDVLRPATLRGLSPDQTLVLVNGKRRHVSALLNINGTIGRGSAAVDMNLIPTLAIERIEVLRDGASSQYGSDAIAGVINVRLKKASSGGRAVASYGKYYTTVENTPGFEGLETTPAGQPILNPADTRYFLAKRSGDRHASDGAIATIGANIGLPVGAGFVNLTAEYRDRNPTNRAGYDLRPNYVPSNGVPAFDPREVTFDRLQFKFGDAKTEDFNVFANAGMPIGPVFELYAFGSFGKRNGLSAANYRSANAVANRDFSALAPGTAPSNANFVPLTPDGFLPLIDTDLKDWAGTLGVRGELAGWNSDLSLGYGHNEFFYTVRDTLNTSFGPQSQSTFDAGGLDFGQWLANLDFSRQFEVGFASPLSIAAGAEFRHENFQITPGELQSYALGPFFRASVVTTSADCTTQSGVFNATTSVCSFPGRQAPAGSQGFPGIPPASETDESRHSYAGYLEFDSEVFANFTATVAGRFEHFSDFGNTLNGKLAMRYEFTPGFAVRGSASNGFRAPSLHQQFFTTTSTNFISGVPVDISTVAVDSPLARALGSQDLDPEKSVNLSVGATANPFRGLNITADFYQIKIDDRIVLTENLTATRDAVGNPCFSGTGCNAIGGAIATILNANGFNSIGAARFFINGLDTTTRGLDIIASYRWRPENLGSWLLTAAYNRNKTKIDKRLNPLDALSSLPGLVLFGREQGLRFTKGQPKSKIVLSADGEIGDFGVTTRSTRYGRALALDAALPLAPNTADLTAIGPDDQWLEPKWITDVELRYALLKRIDLAVGANNLFDVYPTRRPFGRREVGGTYPQNFQYIPYSGTGSPFGFNGRFLYARGGGGF